ncbi:Elongation of very long chain fatty acids protein 5 [Armadillidium vulgare]|nr:Elongation of very long chain fatty acids protein 5 [Armadillidium vulgare]
MDYQTLQWWGLREGGGDPITSKWPGVSSVVYPLSAIGVYLVLVYRNYHREFKTPANIRTYLKFYNIFQVLLSAYIFSETVITAWSAKYNIWCEPLRSTLSYNGRRMAIASYLFHVSKYIDLLDTFFMVVRGNKHQLLLSLVAWNLDPSVSVVETTPDPNADHSILLHVHSHDVWLLQRLPPTHAPRQDSSYLPGCPYRSLHQLLYSNLLEGQSEVPEE